MGEAEDASAFSARYTMELDHAIKKTSGRREPHWTESIAVGSEVFVRGIAALSKGRKRLEIKEWTDASWYERDPAVCYRP